MGILLCEMVDALHRISYGQRGWLRLLRHVLHRERRRLSLLDVRQAHRQYGDTPAAVPDSGGVRHATGGRCIDSDTLTRVRRQPAALQQGV